MTPRAKKTYDAGVKDREPYLERARNCAGLTIPALATREGFTGHDDLPSPNQNFGSRAVNVLAAKMLMGLFPANVPIFKRVLSKAAEMELAGKSEEALKEVTRVLGLIEREATSDMESRGWRPVLFADMRNKIVTGNYLLYHTPEGKLRGYHLSQYVTRRDPFGNHMETVVCEEEAIELLPQEVVALIADDLKPDQKKVKVYTHVFRKGLKFEVYQEVKGHVVPGSEGSYPADRCPWIPGRWSAIEGEHYGRSMVEDYFGDLNALDVLSKAIRESTAIGSKTILMNRPGGLTRARDVVRAENGDVIPGRPEDLVAFQVDKRVDLQTAISFIDRLEDRLGHAFLMNSAVQRNGERVTLGEIRFMIGELNDALGGVYAVQASELQSPLVGLHLTWMERKTLLPKLPKEGLKTTIVTGMEALSREHELQNLQQGLGVVGQLLGPEVLAQTINPDVVIARVMTALRIDPDGLVKSREQIEQEQQAAQLAQATQALGPEAMKMLAQQQQDNQ